MVCLLEFFLPNVRDKTFTVTSENSSICIPFLFIENVSNSLSSFVFLKQMLSRISLLLGGAAV